MSTDTSTDCMADLIIFLVGTATLEIAGHGHRFVCHVASPDLSSCWLSFQQLAGGENIRKFVVVLIAHHIITARWKTEGVHVNLNSTLQHKLRDDTSYSHFSCEENIHILSKFLDYDLYLANFWSFEDFETFFWETLTLDQRDLVIEVHSNVFRLAVESSSEVQKVHKYIKNPKNFIPLKLNNEQDINMPPWPLLAHCTEGKTPILTPTVPTIGGTDC